MIKRAVSEYLKSCVKEYFSVCVFGPRQCGKTTLVQNLFPEYSYANLEDMNTRILAKEDPDEFFTRFPEPVIIDEIQRVPELLSTVQVRIDEFKKKGQYIITGSQQIPLKNTVSQSLAGRVAVVQMQPFSLEELKQSGIKLERDVQLVSGCMPFLFSESGHKPFEYYKNYVQTYLERDIAQIGAVQDLSRFENFMRLLAGRTGQLVNNSAISAEVGVSSTTIGSWLSILESSHLIHILRPLYKNSNGLEVDLILKENENLNLFEVKSGKSLNDEFTKNMQKFLKMNSIEIEKNNSKGTVIYSGETYSSYKDFSYINFHDSSDLFKPKHEPFVLEF